MRIIINAKTIESFRPCSDRYANFILHYRTFDGSVVEFLNLDKITYEDKIWVCKRLLSANILKDWAVLCAESVLCYYEKRTNDLTLRKQLSIIKCYRNLSKDEIKNCANIIRIKRNIAAAAAAAAYADAAADAAYAAHAAAAAAAAAYADAAAPYAAYAAYADTAAAYAAHAAYADADSAAAYAAHAARYSQQKINIDLLIEVLESNNESNIRV